MSIIEYWALLTDFPNNHDSESPMNWAEYLARIQHGGGIDLGLAPSSAAIDEKRKYRTGPRPGY